MARAGKRAYEPLDIGPDCHDWQTVPVLAELIGVHRNALYLALSEERPCNGYELEARDLDDELRDELGLDGRTTRVVRVVRDSGRVDDGDDDTASNGASESNADWKVVAKRVEADLQEKIEKLEAQVESTEQDVAELLGKLDTANLRAEEAEQARADAVERLGEVEDQCDEYLSSMRSAMQAESERVASVIAKKEEEFEKLRADNDTAVAGSVEGGGALVDVAWGILTGEVCMSRAKQEIAKALREG